MAAPCLAASPLRAAASFQTDPAALARRAAATFDQAARDGWHYADEQAYFAALLDAGRAYQLVRPSDPRAATLRADAVDLAVRLNYDPLTNRDGALWYVRAAAQALESDPSRGAAAATLAQKLAAEKDDATRLAADADADASANVAAYPGDAAALVDQVDADLRAYAISKETRYRELALLRASQARFPVGLVRTDTASRLWAEAEAARDGAAGYDATERDAALALLSHRAAVHARPGADLAQTATSPIATAPADEYFGQARLSPLGVRDEIARIGRYLDAGWGARMAPDALYVVEALDDWRRQYPRDYELPKLLLATYELMTRIDSDAARTVATRLRWILVVQYESSPQAQQLLF